MRYGRIRAVLLALPLLLAATGESFAWDLTFDGTRDHLRSACAMVAGEIVETPTDTSCFSHKNGASVVCREDGACEGAGPGPSPRLDATMGRADPAAILSFAAWR